MWGLEGAEGKSSWAQEGRLTRQGPRVAWLEPHCRDLVTSGSSAHGGWSYLGISNSSFCLGIEEEYLQLGLNTLIPKLSWALLLFKNPIW